MSTELKQLQLAQSGRAEEAESWFRQAADQGYTDAMGALGFVLEQSGRMEEAEYWRQRAREQENGGHGD